ncbi:MAG: hypothetical protein ABIJ08_00555 [Nanoarchaeota archaeon]
MADLNLFDAFPDVEFSPELPEIIPALSTLDDKLIGFARVSEGARMSDWKEGSNGNFTGEVFTLTGRMIDSIEQRFYNHPGAYTRKLVDAETGKVLFRGKTPHLPFMVGDVLYAFVASDLYPQKYELISSDGNYFTANHTFNEVRDVMVRDDTLFPKDPLSVNGKLYLPLREAVDRSSGIAAWQYVAIGGQTLSLWAVYPTTDGHAIVEHFNLFNTQGGGKGLISGTIGDVTLSMEKGIQVISGLEGYTRRIFCDAFSGPFYFSKADATNALRNRA